MASKFSFAKITKNLATLFENVTLQYNTIHCIKYELLVPKSNIFCIDLNERNFAYNTVVSCCDASDCNKMQLIRYEIYYP